MGKDRSTSKERLVGGVMLGARQSVASAPAQTVRPRPPATFAVNVGDGPPIAYANGLFTGVRTPALHTHWVGYLRRLRSRGRREHASRIPPPSES